MFGCGTQAGSNAGPVVGGEQASEACGMNVDTKVALEHTRNLGRVSRHQHTCSSSGVGKPILPTETSLTFPRIVPVSTPAFPLSRRSSLVSLLTFRVSWAQGEGGLYPASNQVGLGHPAPKCAVGTYTGMMLLLVWPCRLTAERSCVRWA